MSVKMMAQVWEYEFKPNEQAVMLCLADHSHDDGTLIYPSIARIAWKTGYSERTIQRLIGELVESGVLVLVHAARRYSPNEYAMDLSKATRKSPFVSKYEKDRGDKSAPLNSGVTNELNNGSGVTNNASGVTQLCHPNHHINHHNISNKNNNILLPLSDENNETGEDINFPLNKDEIDKHKNAEAQPERKKRGRPKGSKNKVEEPHDEPSDPNIPLGPKGRPINKRFEIFRAYCECVGDDPDEPLGRPEKLRQFTKELVEAIEPHEVKSLHNFVYRKKNHVAHQMGTREFPVKVAELRTYYSQWRQQQNKRAALAQKMSEEKPITTQTVEVDVEAQLALIAAQRKRFESIVHETIDDVL